MTFQVNSSEALPAKAHFQVTYMTFQVTSSFQLTFEVTYMTFQVTSSEALPAEAHFQGFVAPCSALWSSVYKRQHDHQRYCTCRDTRVSGGGAQGRLLWTRQTEKRLKLRGYKPSICGQTRASGYRRGLENVCPLPPVWCFSSKYTHFT